MPSQVTRSTSRTSDSTAARAPLAFILLSAALVASGVGTPRASAQSHSSHTALPGGGRAVLLQPSDTLATFAAAGGYGYTGPVLGERDRHHRVAGRLALALHPLEALSVGVRTGGYFDVHSGATGSDDSVVGDVGLFALARLAHVGALRLGVGAELWVAPGDGAGLEFAALSPSVSVYSQLDVGGLSLLARVGYLHDRSRQTLPAGRVYTRADQVSLGVTTADALLLGIGAAGRVGSVDLYAEVALDLLVRRSGVPLSASRSSATVGAMLNLATRWQVGAELGAYLGRHPEVRADRFYRVDPRVSLMLLLSVRLGALPSEPDEGDVAAAASLRGTALDDAGTPIAGARVRLESLDETPVTVASSTTAADGAFVLSGVAPGDYDLVVSVDGRHDVRTRHSVQGDVQLADVRVGTFSRALRGRVQAPNPEDLVFASVLDGDTELARVQVAADGTFALEGLPPGTLTLVVEGESAETHRATITPEQSGDLEVITLRTALPAGEIRGTVLGTGGVPLAARVYIDPGAIELVADSEGRFSAVTTPGAHTVRIEADGYARQERTVTVEERGVVVLEAHLRPER